MKKVFILIVCIFTFNCLKSQIVIDTSLYLKDSIQQRKAYYVGKPLSVLLKDLRISIVHNKDLKSILVTKDSFYTTTTTLRFFPIKELFDRINENEITPGIVVTFQDTLAIPRHYFEKGGILDYEEGWTRNKRVFWGQFIVADIRVTGVH